MLVPDYFPKIVEIIRSADWLVHNFDCKDLDIFNPVDYQYNYHLEGINYHVIIDLNFMQYLLNSVRKTNPSEFTRTASAYLVFFQIADIQLDPTYAIYEKINYSSERSDEAIDNLEQFRGLDNFNIHSLAAYALGVTKQLIVSPIPCEERETLKNSILKYRRLTGWDSLYLCVLMITKINNDPAIKRSEKLIAYIDWSISEFRFSLASLVYAATLFGLSPVRGMMKYKADDTYHKKMSSLSNMVWDLYYVDRYMKAWVSEDEYTERLFLTGDKALKLTLRLAIQCQLIESIKPLQPYIGSSFEDVEKRYLSRSTGKRVYKSKDWDVDYRDRLIIALESQLL